jgi:hypothetical protein
MKTKRIIVACFLILGLYACKKKENTTIDLSGKWFENSVWDTNLMLHKEYEFKQNGTLEIVASVMDNTSNETRGYVSKTEGTYSFKGDSLILKDQKVFSTGSHSYKNLNELNYSHTWERTSYKPVYNATNNTLTLQFNCPPNADCIPYPKLKKMK